MQSKIHFGTHTILISFVAVGLTFNAAVPLSLRQTPPSSSAPPSVVCVVVIKAILDVHLVTPTHQ